MIRVLLASWALFLGILLLMIGNGLHGTLLGVRGSLEGFSASTMAYVMSAYFIGFLVGARLTPYLIRRVGHVRVFAALGSLVSAAFILYGALPNPISWALLRFIVGVCICGVYVVAESWLNESSSNENRGQALSAYLIVQMVGIIVAQSLLNLADPADYTLFVVMSVLVSISFAPILLSVSPAPFFDSTKPMSIAQLFRVSPLGMVGTFLCGGIFSAMFGMAAVYSTERGLSAAETSLFIALLYVGGLVLQYPIGWLSDRMDRRRLILGITATGTVAMLIGFVGSGSFTLLCATAFVLGGAANPLYALLIAYTNDFLEPADMAAASGGLLFANGLGASIGPFAIGAMMGAFGPDAFFLYVAGLFAAVTLYAGYRMTRRAAPTVEESNSYAPLSQQASPVFVEVAQEYAIEQAQNEEEAAAPGTPAS